MNLFLFCVHVKKTVTVSLAKLKILALSTRKI